ncbi:MAG: hypothetical protein BGO98_40420 [Myxococcales bacterium 68-20]|nr:MAG: hypothetical protein BGO98_40420 [Myxococcales bacterium 68-20]
MVSAPERMKIRSRTRAASAVKRARGEKLGGLIPFEQRLARDGVRLEANPGEQSIIATIRELAVVGMSRRAIVSELQRRGIVSRTGRTLQITQVNRILTA